MEGGDGWKEASDLLLKSNANMLFVGVYDTERFEPVSLSGATNLPGPGYGGDDVQMLVTPKQVRAIYTHIKFGRTLMAKIDIASLDFVCVRLGSGGLTGMSNFNQEARELGDADRRLFALTRRHYTRQDSLGGVHALNLAALLQDDILAVGISKSREESITDNLKRMLLIKEGKIAVQTRQQDTCASTLATDKHDETRQSGEETSDTAFVFEELDSDYSDEEGELTKVCNKPLTEVARVKMRASTKSAAEKKQDGLKRQTSFCEDWRTATIRSIEALQMFGAAGAGQAHADTEPLLDDLAVYTADRTPPTEYTQPTEYIQAADYTQTVEYTQPVESVPPDADSAHGPHDARRESRVTQV